MESPIRITRPADFFHDLADFRSRRLELISSDLSPITLEKGAKVLLHLVSKTAFDESAFVDVQSLDRPLLPLFTGSSNIRYNFDGRLTYSEGTEGVRSYVQLFHSGVIEAVYVFAELDDKRIIPSTSLRSNLIEATGSYLKKQQMLDVKLPIAVTLTFSGVKGYRLAVAEEYQGYDQYPIDRDTLLMPQTFVNSFESEVSNVLRSLFDRLWNAAGFARCFQYDKEVNTIES